MLSKAASALIAFLQTVSSLAVLDIIIHMFGACEWLWINYAAKGKTTGPIYIVYSLHGYGKVL